MNKLSPRIIITSIALVIAFLLGIFTGFVARAPSTITTIIPITHTVTMTTTYTPTTITTAPPSKVTVVDALGRHIEVKLSVRRVVALSDTSIAALLILGVNVGDVIVGVTEWEYGKIKAGHYQSLNISKLKIVGKTGFNPNYEAIISLRPDLVIAYDE